MDKLSINRDIRSVYYDRVSNTKAVAVFNLIEAYPLHLPMQ